MRMTNGIHWRLESVGRPEHTSQSDGTVREFVLSLTQWLAKSTMGHRLRITVARDEEGLNERNRSGAPDDMIRELESILDGHAFASGIDKEESDGPQA